jgi:branched-chain amino acid transport system ATP-binding protein
MDKILQTENLTRHFGGVRAVESVNMGVERGQIHAVIGPNGAGKSTLFNLITNFIEPDSGRVLFNGQEITGQPAHAICRMGIARSFQLTNIYPKLTVFDSVQMSLISHRGLAGNFFKSRRSVLKDETEKILEMFGLADQRNVMGELLPHGDKKRLELAVSLGNEPSLLLMDEPTAGMAPEETWSTVKLIHMLAREHNITILFSEHNMDVVFDIADQISVLYYGQIIFEGAPSEVQKNEKVREVYLGQT